MICGEKLPEIQDYQGKKVSILGDSISTYSGVSDDVNVNSTLNGGAIYYTPGRWDVYQKDTWWQQTIEALDMKLLVNNSWSGSCVLHTRHNTVGAYIDRCTQLHNEYTNENPDVIFVFIGANDFSYYQDTLGSSDINYNELIVSNSDGSFSYKEPLTTCEAYAIMLHKIIIRYPDAEVFCMMPLARRYPDYNDGYEDVGQPTDFNNNLMTIVKYFNLNVVDLEKCGIDKEEETFDKYIADKRTHPNALGMDMITNYLVSTMLNKDVKVYNIDKNLENVYLDNNFESILSNNSFYSNIKIEDQYTLNNVSIIMDGLDITSDVYSNGVIYIKEVTGNVEIIINAERPLLDFSWTVDSSGIVSNGENQNNITLIDGSIKDGMIVEGRFELSKSVELKHNVEWEIEWRCSEDWRGVILSNNSRQKTNGLTYISRSVGGMLVIGSWDGSQYNNYGIDISNLDDNVHTYRLVNKIENNKNMVYLYIDDLFIGAMNNYFIGSNSQNTTSNWISGKDFTMSFIGIEGHTLKNCRLEYFKIFEEGRNI